MAPDEYVCARLGIAFPPSGKGKLVVMAGLVSRWDSALRYAIMGTFDDDYDTHVTDLFDAWTRGEIDIIDCAQRQIAYEVRRGIFDEHGRLRDDALDG
jgi:hypothetical protein